VFSPVTTELLAAAGPQNLGILSFGGRLLPQLLAGQRNALFAVGDDDQSIYAFRGANVGNMQELTRDFNVQSVLKLEQNYRSHGNILDAANALIKNNRSRLGMYGWYC
jgi:DNA helicase-2/ATP-dependent DNA helicase PcrA